MTKFSVLTSEAKTIVVNFFSAQMKKSIFSEPYKQLMVSLYSLMPDANSKVLEILDKYIISLSEFMSDKDISALKAEYPAVVKYCFDSKKYDGIIKSAENFIIPPSLIELCMTIAEPKAGSKVFVPYSGDGSFASQVLDCSVEGFENDTESWAISQILLHSQNSAADIQLGDAAISNDKQFDYIFSFPPLYQGKKQRELVDQFYNLITKHLAGNGEIYCFLPHIFCSAGHVWFDIRKILWDYCGKYSVLVIDLPPILQMFSNIDICLLHIKKNNKDKVVLMDARGEEFSARRDVAGNKDFVLKTQSIIETLKSQDEKYVWFGNSKQLTGEISLLPSRYLISQHLPKPLQGEKAFRLSNVIEIVGVYERNGIIRLSDKKGNEIWINKNEDPSVKALLDRSYVQKKHVIGIKDLSGNYLNCDIKAENLPADRKEHGWSVLTSDCLLVGFHGGKIKVGRVHGASTENPVTLHSDIIPFKVISDVVTEDFILRCLLSENAEYQAQCLSTGTMMSSRISPKDFLSIVINIPLSKEQQEAICKEDTRKSLTEADRKIIESFEEFRKDMHMKKHAIGQTLFNLNNWWDALMQARKEGNGIVSDDATTGRIRKVSISNIYDSLQKAINQLQQQINKFDRGNGLAVKKFALTEFIEDYISRKQSPLFTFFYEGLQHHVPQSIYEVKYDEITGEPYETDNIKIKEGDPIEYVEFAPDALEIIFDNIVSNACCHGFKDSPDRANVIKIELKSEGDNFVIMLSNNGSPIHSQLKPEEVFVYGKTSKMGKSVGKYETHFGIGGYEVQKLMREFGGEAEFISDSESDFPISYKLTFYNTNIENVNI